MNTFNNRDDSQMHSVREAGLERLDSVRFHL